MTKEVINVSTGATAAVCRPDYSITDAEVAIIRTVVMQAAPGSWSVNDFACECCGNTIVAIRPASDALVGPRFELSRNRDHRIDLRTSWLDGEDYSSEIWLLHVALLSVLSTITEAMAEMQHPHRHSSIRSTN
jgi:hypothetical protein